MLRAEPGARQQTGIRGASGDARASRPSRMSSGMSSTGCLLEERLRGHPQDFGNADQVRQRKSPLPHFVAVDRAGGAPQLRAERRLGESRLVPERPEALANPGVQFPVFFRCHFVTINVAQEHDTLKT